MGRHADTVKRDPADDVPPPPWASLRRRSEQRERPRLDRTAIVATALRIVDAEGADHVSFRRVAQELGVSAMALYWHVADKDELLELVGHAVLDEIRIPETDGDWREQLRDVHRAMLAGVSKHPNATDLVIGRARYGATGLALFERILSILLGAGLTPAAAFDAYDSLYLFTLGFLATSTRTPAFVEAQRQGIGYMRSLPAERFPSIARVVPVIGRRSSEERFEIALDVQIEGIEARLATPATAFWPS